MRRLRWRFTLPALGGLGAVVGLFAALGTGSAPAAVDHSVRHSVAVQSAAQKVSVVLVTAGKPSELAFKLSKTSLVPVGTVTFKVTNLGVAFHNFKICTIPVPSAAGAKNFCIGTSTKTLKHGQSQTFTVKFSLAGKYEFLCTVPGHAAAGMKGLLGVGVAISASEQAAAATAGKLLTSGGSGTTTTKVGSGGGGTGDTSGCAAGVTIRSSGAADADGDELGTEPDDNDGCI
jgi:uncharacterized cupredoxin-like copper-binding protein